MQKKSRRSPRAALADVKTDAELIRLGHERDVAFAHANPSGQVLDDGELSDRCDVLNELEYAI
jgi:hypothetical protein